MIIEKFMCFNLSQYLNMVNKYQKIRPSDAKIMNDLESLNILGTFNELIKPYLTIGVFTIP